MNINTSGIDTDALARQIRARYDFPVTSMTFVPKGEDAYCFAAESALGNRYFVRAQAGGQSGHSSAAFLHVDDLRSRYDLPALVSPLLSINGAIDFRFDSYQVAVFPFIDGDTAYDAGLSDAQWREIARFFARLHTCECDRTNSLPPLVRKTFANPFDTAIRESIELAVAITPAASAWQKQTADLLLREQGDVLRSLQTMRDVAGVLDAYNFQMVPTHGDPNLANIIIAPDEGLQVIDWGDIALGPRERDLNFFTDEQFAMFMRHYLAASPPIVLHLPLFTYYDYLWVFQEIADYCSPVLKGMLRDEEAEHAWEELRPYLPIQHQEIREKACKVARVLEQLESEGLVTVSPSRRAAD